MEKGAEQIGITAKKAENFDEWYPQVTIKSGFVDYTPISGCLAFRPDSYFAWEVIQQAVDALLKKEGVQNTYFPLLIPKRLLEKEAEHIAGFSPEVAWVTKTGNSTLSEDLAIRPTSEAIMYECMAGWIRSWRDLPMRLNQWNSVLRWEFKHPVPLLRSREFLWNEGHSAFASQKEADSERDVVFEIYLKVLKEYLALPGVPGRKSDSEKFAGAVASYSIEHMLPDGRAIQGPDFHSDGQNFAKAFNISFIDKDGKQEFAYQNTFAITTRELGVMVATHSDDRGLIIPPKLARIQVVIVPIYTDKNKESVLKEASKLHSEIKGKVRTYLDDRDIYSPGWKFNEWELKGVPVRLELGERDISAGKVVAVNRLTLKKESIALKDAANGVSAMLDKIQEDLYKNAEHLLTSSTHHVDSYDDMKKLSKSKGGFAQAGWCGDASCETKSKGETGMKITNLPLDAQSKAKSAKCVVCGKPAKHIANFAKSY